MSRYEQRLAALLKERADVEVNGSRPWDIKVYDVPHFRQMLPRGSLAIGEGFMRGKWGCDDLEEMAYRVLRGNLGRTIRGWSDLCLLLQSLFLNMQSTVRSWDVGKKHYDLGNDFYGLLLGPTMTYSCAVWDDVETLDEAQLQKYERLCKKLKLQGGENILEIGCGWGSFAKYAATHYGAKIVCLTISQQQAAYAKKEYEGLPVAFLLSDYREADVLGALKELDPAAEAFDCVMSIGMFEHVGRKNYRSYMAFAFKHLKEGGLFVCHTIVGKGGADAFINTYIFPGGYIPAMWEVVKAAEGAGFVVEHVENIGVNYHRTLMAWYANFLKHWKEIERMLGDNVVEQFGSIENFFCAFTYYLLTCPASFRARENGVGQFVLAKHGVLGGYRLSAF